MSSFPDNDCSFNKCKDCSCLNKNRQECSNHTPKIFCQFQERYIPVILCGKGDCFFKKNAKLECNFNRLL